MRTPWGNKFLTALFCSLLFLTLAFASNQSPITAQDVVTGRPITLDFSSSKRETILVFLSARCPCSAAHEETLKNLYEQYSKKGFAFFGIHANADESLELAREHFKNADLLFPILEDRDQKILDIFHAKKTPHVFIVNSKQEIVYQGGVDSSHTPSPNVIPHLKIALTQLEKNEKPDPVDSRTLGCVIKRKEK